MTTKNKTEEIAPYSHWGIKRKLEREENETETCANCGHLEENHFDDDFNGNGCHFEYYSRRCPCKKFTPQTQSPKVFIERAEPLTIEGIRAICMSDKDYDKYRKEKDLRGSLSDKILQIDPNNNLDSVIKTKENGRIC